MDFSARGDLKMQKKKGRNPNRRYSIARNEPKKCTECHKYDRCKELCPEVERWANQDQVGGGGYLLGNKSSDFGDSLSFVDLMSLNHEDILLRDEDHADEAWERVKRLNLSKASLEFVDLYYRQGKKKCEIAEILNISDQAVDCRQKSAMSLIRERFGREKVYSVLKHLNFVEGSILSDVLVLYFDLYKSKNEVAKIVGVNVKTVYECTSKLLDLYKKLLDTEDMV